MHDYRIIINAVQSLNVIKIIVLFVFISSWASKLNWIMLTRLIYFDHFCNECSSDSNKLLHRQPGPIGCDPGHVLHTLPVQGGLGAEVGPAFFYVPVLPFYPDTLSKH